MLRYLDFTLVLAVIASSALASAPCFCADQGAPVEVVEAPVEADRGCCPGSEQDEAPAAPEHDCPHCATGQCDQLASVDPLDVPVAALSATVTPPPFTVAHIWGEQAAPVAVHAAPAAPRVVAASDVAPTHRQDTYALTRVIRC